MRNTLMEEISRLAYLIVVTNIETQAEKDVIPNEHLHLWILSRIDSHHVSINDGNRSASRSRHKIAVHFENGSFT